MIAVLETFKSDVNANAQIQRIVKGWNTGILLEEKNTAISYMLQIKEGKIDAIKKFNASEAPDCETKIAGNDDTMQGLFEGKVNPIRANNEGLIEIYGSMGDQVKLDAIALILWGI